jgi:hypothetical protein
MPELKIELPDWTEAAGGRDRWHAWVEGQVRRCRARAAEWVRDHGRSLLLRPGAGEWRQAILAALKKSEGCGAFSRFALSMAPPRKSTDWNWPSVDHLKAPNVAEVAIETRLVNDVKGIMTEEEFRSLIGHLAVAMNVIPRENLDWRCGRSFAAPEPPSEPPLPASKGDALENPNDQ